ncbi:MAG: MFS transporter [Candidatus Nanoarchaeia archaeon]|nr:MFS transporter [Candidatus Nanoarchaeia archaeon]
MRKKADLDDDDDDGHVHSLSNIKELKYKSRVSSIKSGIFASAKGSFGDSFFSPFAIAVNASNSLVALLTAISGILGPLSQIFGSRLMERYSRKKIILRTIFFEFLLWIPFIAIAVLYWAGIIRNALAIIFTFFFAFYIIIANVNLPAWFSWTGDIINERYRGRWFSKRNVLMGFVSVILALLASLILDYFTRMNLIMAGFIILFSLAFASRIISWSFYKKQYEPPLKLKKGYYFTFVEFLIRARKTNFGRFSFFNALLNLAVAISSPLFVIYMLRDLHFSYFVYMLLVLSGTVFSLLVMELWGKICDKFGDYFVMRITGIIIPFIPVLWIFSSSPVYLIFVPILLNGVAWAGFNLASNNFVYDNVRPEKRGLALSYFNMLTGIGIFIGAAIGAFLIRFLNIKFMLPIFFIFVLSGVLMMMVVIVFMPMMKEAREIKPRKAKKMRSLIFKQFKPCVLGEVHEILSLKRYFRR